MNDKQIQVKLGIISGSIADLIEQHEDLMQEDNYITDRITMSRKSLEFFLEVGDHPRALYEAKNCHQDIMSWLGWV